MSQKTLIALGAIFLLLLLLAGSFSGGYFFSLFVQERFDRGVPVPSEFSDESFDLIQEVMHLVKRNYVEKVSSKKLVEGAIRGILESLDDPHTQYLKKSEYDIFHEGMSGSYEGVGMYIGTEKDRVVVISTFKNSPAERAGIKDGDYILKVDGRSTHKMAADVAARLIKGKGGTVVKLTIKRDNKKEPMMFEIKREKIEIPNIASKRMDGNLGYIKLHTFATNTGVDLKKEVKELKSKGAKGIILDLRSNPGGRLDEAVAVSSVFIESGTVVKTKTKEGRETIYIAKGDAFEDIPLVVVVDRGSASASEIVAGAVQDWKRGVIVGEKTFGKGSVQDVIRLSNGGALILTIQLWLTPSGKTIHKKGIKPDIIVKVDRKKKEKEEKDIQLERAKKELKNLIKKKRDKAA